MASIQSAATNRDGAEPWALRNLLLRSGSPLCVIFTPVIAFGAIIVVNLYFAIPPMISAEACQTETISTAPITAKVSPDGAIGLQVALPKPAAETPSAKATEGKTSSILCGGSTKAEQADMAQARTLTIITFTTAIMAGAVILGLSIFTIGRFSDSSRTRWVWLGGSVVAAGLAVFCLVVWWKILPDPSLIDLLNLLGSQTAVHHKLAKFLATAGAVAEVIVVVFLNCRDGGHCPPARQ